MVDLKSRAVSLWPVSWSKGCGLQLVKQITQTFFYAFEGFYLTPKGSVPFSRGYEVMSDLHDKVLSSLMDWMLLCFTVISRRSHHRLLICSVSFDLTSDSRKFISFFITRCVQVHQ